MDKVILEGTPSCAKVGAGASNTLGIAVATPTESGVLSRPKFGILAHGHVRGFGRDGQSGNAWRTAIPVLLTSRPPVDRSKSASGFKSRIGAFRMAHATTTPTPGNISTIVDALRSILREVTPGQRPFSSDSYLPDHLIDQARQALDGYKAEPVDRHHKNVAADRAAIELHQLSHNALASAAWHVARGEAAQALSRIKRAQAHLAHSMEGGAG